MKTIRLENWKKNGNKSHFLIQETNKKEKLNFLKGTRLFLSKFCGIFERNYNRLFKFLSLKRGFKKEYRWENYSERFPFKNR